jgi:4-hydroxy-tetrahydrodipicolinate reductase
LESGSVGSSGDQGLFAGVTGWTAPPILAAIAAADDMTLTCGVARSAAGRPLAEVTGLAVSGSVYPTVSDALAGARVDVLVDFTSAAAVRRNVWAAVQAGAHAVVGSSGLTADDYAQLDRLARERGVGVIAAGNFSVLAAVLRRAAALAAAHLSQWEIIGLRRRPQAGRNQRHVTGAGRKPRRSPVPTTTVAVSEVQGPVEARGAEVAGARVHSVRLPSFVVSTEIVFGAPGDRLIMRHEPGLTPEPYVAGTLLAIRRVADESGVRRGLDGLLFTE